MSVICPKCFSNLLVRYGKKNDKQKYKCKNCSCVFLPRNPKYSNDFKLECVQMYLESMTIRGISRVKKIHNSNISYWIKKAGEIAEKEFRKKQV